MAEPVKQITPASGIINTAMKSVAPSGNTTTPGPATQTPPADQLPPSPVQPTQPQQTYTPSPVGPATPETRPQDTVAGNLTALLDRSNPYIQQNEREAQRFAGSRGLINSTIAARAGREAAIKSALPIAQQDAQTNAKLTENVQANELNKDFATLDNNLAMIKEANSQGLRLQVETALANQKISLDQRQMFAQEASRIITETQTQIGAVGTSQKTPEQQTAAINQLVEQRDSQISMLLNLMQASADWDWFTQGASTAAAPTPAPVPASTQPPPRQGVTYDEQGNVITGTSRWQPPA